MSVFISYSRWNKPFGDHLRLDLQRAGLTVWLDMFDLDAGRGWNDAIRTAIEAATHVVVLMSPESAKSEVVLQEVAYAQSLGKPLVPLLVGGEPESLPHGWPKLHMLDFRKRHYREMLPEVLRNLDPKLPVPLGYDSFLDRPGVTTAHAARELGGRTIHSHGRAFAVIPTGPTGYTTTCLIGPADQEFRLPREVAGLLHFSGPDSRRADQDVLDHLNGASPTGPEWLIAVTGPVNPHEHRYELTDPHVWRDGVEASVRAVEWFLKGRDVRLFLNCPVPLGFAVGVRGKDFFQSYTLYHFSGGSYKMTYERK